MKGVNAMKYAIDAEHGYTKALQYRRAFVISDTVWVFLGSIGAARKGLTLTVAITAMFAELGWVPGNVTQGGDRIHRIGQHDAVTIQHILDGSLDAQMAQTLITKQELLDQALDWQHTHRETLDYPTADDREKTRTEVVETAGV